MASGKGRPAEGRRRRQEIAILGTNALDVPSGGEHNLSLTRTPVATGGTHVIQLVDGEVSRAIAVRTEAGMAREGRPARRGELRAWNHNDGIGIEIAMQAHRPVYTRTVDGREEIVYKSSEMDEGKIYTVEWDGEHYALRRSGPNVEIFKFRADDGGG